MKPERRRQLAKGLAKNELLLELFEDRAAELREAWENTQAHESDKREITWLELHATNETRDYFYARINDYVGDDEKN